jgi:hypothetical protein
VPDNNMPQVRNNKAYLMHKNTVKKAVEGAARILVTGFANFNFRTNPEDELIFKKKSMKFCVQARKLTSSLALSASSKIMP